MSFNAFNIGRKPKDLGPVIHRLKVRINAEHNRALKIWEHELALHFKPKPKWLPEFVWKRLKNMVIVQNVEVLAAPDYLKGA
jgi:hypothetical protein